MSVFGGHFLVLFQCVMTVSWNQPQPGCWNYLYYILIHSCKYTTFQIRTVFNNVLFSSEVHNPLHAHLLALSHICVLGSEFGHVQLLTTGAGIAQWLERRTRDWKVAGSNPCWNGGRIFFSRVDFLCWLLFRYPFHPRVTTVACKRSRSFCQKCRWQVTAKHAYTLRMWLCMKWHGAWLYGVHRTCAETAAVSCGTSHASAVSTPLRWIFKKTRYKS